MGPQYSISSATLAAATWYKMGTFSLASANTFRTLEIELTTQNPIGTFRSAVIRFSSNAGNVVQMTYDNTVGFDAYVLVQTISKDWIYTVTSDIAVTRVGSGTYAFYLKVYPNAGAGFFTVRHVPGDAFVFEGTYGSTTRPPNGVHPNILAVATPEGIGGLPVVDPEVYGTLSTENLTASGSVSLPNNALTIAKTSGLQTALDSKAPTSNPTFTGLTTCDSFNATGFVAFPNNSIAQDSVSGLLTALNSKAPTHNPTFTGNVQLPQFQQIFNASLKGSTACDTSLFAPLVGASSSFTTLYGSQNPMTQGVSSTLYTIPSGGVRGLIFCDTDPVNASSCLAYFCSMTGVHSLNILSRAGNALGASNLGTTNSGTFNMTLAINAAGQLRASVTAAGGFIRWNILLLSAVL